MEDIYFNSEVITIPPTAVIIKVTNLLTPYIIRVYEVKHYHEKLNIINKKLLTTKQILSSGERTTEPKVGDAVLVCNRFGRKIDFPGWLCRGYVLNVQNIKDTYIIFLLDYGISIVSSRKDFIVCSHDLNSFEHLSFTVGLYHVLPATVKLDLLMRKQALIISKEWSSSAIEYTKDLLSVAHTIYFDPLMCDKYGKYYGEFYLHIKDNVIRLSEILVLNHYAIYIKRELLKFIENPKDNIGMEKEVISHEAVFYLHISRQSNTNNKYSNLRKRCKECAEPKQKNYLCNEFGKGKEKVLTYGRDKVEYLNSALDAKFPVEMHKAWKSIMLSSNPKKIQSYLWPALQKGLDIIAIGTEKSGKTVGCAFAICGLLAICSKLPQGMNPSALILCSSSSEVLEVNSLCTEFLQSYKTIKSVAAINGISERTLVAKMFNGCQIMISTPCFLARFMDRNRKLLNFENLRYLVLDDGAVILDKYSISISQLFRKHNIVCNRESKKKMLQIVITASHWTANINKLASIVMDNPYICITSFVEAAIFKSVRLNVYVINSKRKDKQIFELLGNEYSKTRTIVVCRNYEEAEKLHNYLAKFKDTLLSHENMNFTHLQDIKQYWNACIRGSYPILISTDDVLSDIGITNVTWLIHYSVSLRFRTQFSFRFSTLFDSLEMDHSNSKVTIIVDENNDMQFPHIIKIMQRLNVLIPPNVYESVKLITATLEERKKNYPICDNVKSWAFCNKQGSCAFRHKIISEIDNPLTKIHINDRVKFIIVTIHDVTHFSARIVSYIKSDTLEEVEFSNTEYIQTTMRLQKFYSDIENRMKCDIINIGDICGLEEPVDTFKRVQVLYINEEKMGRPTYVDVRCMDSGIILNNINTCRLLYMPKELEMHSTQVMEVFLVGIAPHDNEYVWNNCAIAVVHQWFKENIDASSYVTGTVNLHLGNTIWVDTLHIGTKLIGYEDIIGSSLSTQLLNRDQAVVYDGHMKQMYQLCRDGGFVEINGYDLYKFRYV